MKIQKRTKIVATIGPATASKEMLEKIIEAGVNVCRINFSHGAYEDHQQVINNVRRINIEKGIHTAILADLQGPKLRIGKVKDNQIFINVGDEITLTTKECIGDNEKLYINYEEFPRDVSENEIVLLDDGKLQLKVIATDKVKNVKTVVVQGGKLSSNKGVNLPNTKVSLPCLTEKDLADLDFALKNDLEWIGLSFVRSASDIIELKHIIKNNQKASRVVAKIEKPEAITDIDNIIKIADAIMVARGDLGVELPMEQLPMIQKMLVRKCFQFAKPIIIATQMMESMIENITPTRAEVNDVANSVLDGADAIMFSAETSVGKFPVSVIEAAAKIINNVEKFDGIFHRKFVPIQGEKERFISDSICETACNMSEKIDIKAIITMTHSGYTATKIASYRPNAFIFVFTSNKALLNALSLVWGVKCFYYDKLISTDHTIDDIKYILTKDEFLKKGEMVVNITSMPIAEKGKTNMLKLTLVE
jgi:pyruvate kinase